MNFHQSPSSRHSSHQSTPKNLRKHNHGVCPSMEIEETPGLHEPFETSESWCQVLSWCPGRSQARNEMMYQNDRQWSTVPLAFRLSRAASSCPSRQTPVLNLQRSNSHIAITKNNWYSKQFCSSPAWCLCSCGDSRGGRRCVTHRSAHRCSWTIGRHDLRTVLPFTTLEDTIMAYVVTFSFKSDNFCCFASQYSISETGSTKKHHSESKSEHVPTQQFYFITWTARASLGIKVWTSLYGNHSKLIPVVQSCPNKEPS